MADIALDAEALRRDRLRYQRLLDQVEQQVAAWNERAGHLRTTIGGLDHLLELAGAEGSPEVAAPRRAARGAPASTNGPTASMEPARPAPANKAKAAATAEARTTGATEPPPPAATPAAPEPIEPPGATEAEAPRGTDALRMVLEADPKRTWSLAELLEALGTRGWLPTSRRPEEGVRISLKRLVERGGAVRTDDGRWRLADEVEQPADSGGTAQPAGSVGTAQPAGSGGTTHWPDAGPPLAPEAPVAEAAPAAEEPPPPPPRPPTPPPRPASFGRPVGGTVTEL